MKTKWKAITSQTPARGAVRVCASEDEHYIESNPQPSLNLALSQECPYGSKYEQSNKPHPSPSEYIVCSITGQETSACLNLMQLTQWQDSGFLKVTSSSYSDAPPQTQIDSYLCSFTSFLRMTSRQNRQLHTASLKPHPKHQRGCIMCSMSSLDSKGRFDIQINSTAPLLLGHPCRGRQGWCDPWKVAEITPLE